MFGQLGINLLAAGTLQQFSTMRKRKKERKRERERERKKERKREGESVSVCVCVQWRMFYNES